MVAEHGHPVVRDFVGFAGHPLAADIVVEAAIEQVEIIRVPGQHFVVDPHGAGDHVLAALFRLAHAEQPDDVGGIVVRVQRRAGRVAARVGCVDVDADILDPADQIALRVLRDHVAEMDRDTPIEPVQRRLVVALDGDAAQQGEAAPVLQLLQHAGEDGA